MFSWIGFCPITKRNIYLTKHDVYNLWYIYRTDKKYLDAHHLVGNWDKFRWNHVSCGYASKEKALEHGKQWMSQKVLSWLEEGF